MPKYGNLAPDSLKIENFEHFDRHWKRFTNTLPTIPQPFHVDDFKQRSVQKRVLGPKCPNMVIWFYLAPDPAKD